MCLLPALNNHCPQFVRPARLPHSHCTSLLLPATCHPPQTAHKQGALCAVAVVRHLRVRCLDDGPAQPHPDPPGPRSLVSADGLMHPPAPGTDTPSDLAGCASRIDPAAGAAFAAAARPPPAASNGAQNAPPH